MFKFCTLAFITIVVFYAMNFHDANMVKDNTVPEVK